ncbi:MULTISPECIES: hypothetical protein [unclassified Tenacibaculum]|uniref:hypothetical protein n=1 Tax=unclassified Tenacibaculum TaxID=2635139 RepID=UPI001F265840|nr:MULTISPECIES: hypothetical protein [unclassified Tenacibaculum]MCF2874271.1 hypothetical protein [Tenacibaculum sp. Cn5-1]MCF2934852.1 hypothetical protein [Tenacibaculum sp. Cn5-34]MCG7511062.1 hypothetical protein [Tenacibaculum sp. Cn5-46]
MKRILLLVLFVTTIAHSQEKNFEEEVSKIAKKIEKITKQEKDSLKLKVKSINDKLEKKIITQEDAKKLKKEAAELHATRIETRVSVQERKLQQLVQDKTNGRIASNSEEDESFVFRVGGAKFKFLGETERRKKKKRDKRTTTQFVFAMGVNNVLTNNEFSSLNDSNYKFWQSHFYELGFTWKTRFSKDPSKLYFKYGISFLWNNLRAKNNQYHVVNGDQTVLNTHINNLSESRLRHVQMTFPMHIELDLSKNKTNSDKEVIDNTHDSFQFGIGGFFGFKLGTRQYLEYRNAQGVKVEEVQKAGFNTNVINYGLSAYASYKGCGLYAKYDLNPLFKGTSTRNISLGVRFDIN